MDNRALDEPDALEESADARPDLDGVDGLEVSGELVPVGDHALDGRSDGDLGACIGGGALLHPDAATTRIAAAAQPRGELCRRPV